ncbi:HBL385Cp [Eremothecium sinecaudum]|uniref:HBL385Cp n=1 Tax=Eremothecium sinecaudum TaxID=45286 RepID=A0A109UWN1_9SACH|nr:HBL385Cp [Eremothecium sinecaudum]AMD18517.1 HBL385Cp [Eremothecium sinecaudum]
MSEDGKESYLMATRSRRSNAGNLMAKLLEQERQRESLAVDVDDNEINLLFQEEEDDKEFLIDDKKQENDELFSDSGDESSDTGGSGEEDKEESRRSAKKRKLAKLMIPRVKSADSRKKDAGKKLKPSYEQPKAKSLLVNTRRTSSRSSVVRNKMEVYEKLAQAEVKRKEIQERIKKQRQTQFEEALTQEDRLRIAEETERINLLSLNKYKEQEVSKKQSRLAMQQRQKMKFKQGEPIVTWLTTQWSVTPAMEVYDHEYWEQFMSKRQKKKRKYVRRKRDNLESSKEEDAVKTPPAGDIPSSKGTSPSVEGDEASQCSAPVEPQNSADVKSELDVPDLNAATSTNTEELQPSASSAEKHESPPAASPSKQDSINPSIDMGDVAQNSSEILAEQASEKHISFLEKDDVAIIDSNEPPSSIIVDETRFNTQESQNSSTLESHEDSIKIQDEVSFQESDNGNGEEFIEYEGPAQLVGKNFLLLSMFPDLPMEVGNSNALKSVLFGEQWSKPLNSKSLNVEPLLKISWVADSNEKEQLSLIPDSSIIDKFPSFGEYDKKLSQEVVVATDKGLKVDIQTEAPTGVFLPNGIRKKCLITNKDSQYFDPKNGIQYADVEAIKTIQDIQDPIGDGSIEKPNPRFRWFGFGRGGIFLDVQQRPAKGVPEGFFLDPTED